MSNYDQNKVIESLKVRFVKSNHEEVIHPVTVWNNHEVESFLILITKGVISFGNEKEKTKAEAGDIVFIPGGKSTTISYGNDAVINLSKDHFLSNYNQYIKSINQDNTSSISDTTFCFVAFEAKSFNAINLFSTLDLPAFKITDSDSLKKLIHRIHEESTIENIGSNRATELFTELLVIALFRYLWEKNLFIEKLTTNINHFKEERLLKLFEFINSNLGNDLSNKRLAAVANVSEDYIGQYFKNLTGINPQDFIEYQRMEYSVHLLRTTKMSVKEIGKQVGYKDTAYFCRRFKMIFGIPAGKMRKRESLVNPPLV